MQAREKVRISYLYIHSGPILQITSSQLKKWHDGNDILEQMVINTLQQNSYSQFLGTTVTFFFFSI